MCGKDPRASGVGVDAPGRVRRAARDSGWRASRRDLLRAGATFGALAAAGGVAQAGRRPNVARAQDAAPETLAGTWVEAEQVGAFAVAAAGAPTVVPADFPFYAVGVHWAGEGGTAPTIELGFSWDGATFTDPVYVNAQNVDAGRPDRDGRIFTDLAFPDGGASFVQYRALDADGNPTSVPDLAVTYIDATAGPTVDQVFAPAALPALEQPPIISRAGWGANESYRYDSLGVGWTPEYAEVRHAIIHHTVTPNFQDPLVAIRSIYYYHAVTRGWGDIGYNYLTDYLGNIYEGRWGGENVVGGHAYQYAFGSSGIAVMGTHTSADITAATRSALIAITAWVTRNLDPLGFEDFLEVPDLPTICGHRDVTQDTCPGNGLYDDLPGIRSGVQAILDATEGPPSEPVEPPPAAEFTTGDNVVINTNLNLREEPRTNAPVIDLMPAGTLAAIIGLARPISGLVWYPIRTQYGDGWAAGNYFDPAPAGNPPAAKFEIGEFATVNVNGLSLRSRPGLPQTQIAVLPFGTRVEITDGDVVATGYRWYGVYNVNYGGGWVAQDFLSGTAPPPPDEFEIGDPIVVDTDALNLRNGPGTGSAVVATMPGGTTGTVVGGPQSANGYTWWQIQTSQYGTGWAAGEFLSPGSGTPPPPPPPNAEFEIGDPVYVDTDQLYLRNGPGTGSTVLASMVANTTGTVVGGPMAANGYTWWQIETSAYGTGWAAGEYLSLDEGTSPPPPPPPPTGGEFDIGDAVFVDTDQLYLRSGAGTSATVLASMVAGTTGTVLAGPQSANGYTWWRIQTSAYGTGWAAGEYLSLDEGTSPPPPPPPPTGGEFDVGDAVYVDSNDLYLRSAAGTGSTVLAVMAINTTGTVLAGPQSANGYTWWRIQTTAYGTGWAAGEFLSLDEGTTPPPPPPPPTGGEFDIGDAVFVDTDQLYLRSGAGTSATVLASMVAGTTGTVLAGPQSANGYTWWRIQTSAYGTGWAAGEYLSLSGGGSPPPPPPSGGIGIGDTVRVTEALNFRTGPSTGNAVIAVLPAGAQLTVVGGPSSGGGYSWWQLQSATYGTGWTAADWLVEV